MHIRNGKLGCCGSGSALREHVVRVSRAQLIAAQQRGLAAVVDENGQLVSSDVPSGAAMAATAAGATSAVEAFFVNDPAKVIQWKTVLNGAMAGVTGWAAIKLISALTGAKR